MNGAINKNVRLKPIIEFSANIPLNTIMTVNNMENALCSPFVLITL